MIEGGWMSGTTSLFEHTKMTFGEHLDELRAALIKSVLALAIGFGIALWPPISGGVVEYVQTPLKAALDGLLPRPGPPRGVCGFSNSSG